MSIHQRDSLTFIPHHLFNQGKLRPNAPGYFFYQDGDWHSVSWKKYIHQIRAVGEQFLQFGIAPQDRVCILGFNRPEWTVTALATMCIQAIPTGIYTTSSPQEIYYILSHSEAKIVVVEHLSHWFIIHQLLPNLPHLKKVILMTGAWDLDPSHPAFCEEELPFPPQFFTLSPLKEEFHALDQKRWTWSELCLAASSDESTLSWETLTHSDQDQETHPSWVLLFEERLSSIQKDQVATLIYTSGTTGSPKAVMLTHHNLAWMVHTGQQYIGFTHQDSTLSYLPLSHIAEQLFTLYGTVSVGFPVYFARSIDLLLEDLKTVRPTLFFAVPRVWEKIYHGLNERLIHLKGLKKTLIPRLQKIALNVNLLKNQDQKLTFQHRLRYAVAQHLFGRVKAALGLDRARLCLTGAAPIRKEILRFFASLDLRIHEVYGQSEGCGITTFNTPSHTQFGTVGLPLLGSEVVLAEDGEVWVKGPHIFKGYFKDPQATQDVLDSDGFLKSGDLGTFNDQGYLEIIGRKKEMIITSGGKNIAPKGIEGALCSFPLISQAIVIGDQRKFLSVLLTLNPESLLQKQKDHPDLFPSLDSIHISPPILQEVSFLVDQVNQHLAQVEKIKQFTLLPREFSVEAGELTPTLKLKRSVILKLYQSEIDLMYMDAL